MSAAHDALAGWLCSPEAATAALPDALAAVERARLSVHRNTFIATLVEALVASFPICAALVGGDCLRAGARAFVLADPPRSPVVAEYADRFPAFVAAWPPLAEMPFVADVARVEALRLRAFDAADAMPLAADAFAPLVADPSALARTGVALHPAAQWLRAATPAFDLWFAHQASPLDAVDLHGVDLSRAQDVLVTRPVYEPAVHLLPPGGATFLDALRDGSCLAGAMAEALAEPPRGTSANARAAQLFRLLITHGLVVSLRLAFPPHAAPEAR